METRENPAAPTEIAAHKCHVPADNPNESKRAWEAFFAAIEERRAEGDVDGFIGEEAA